ncbi:uncharacterized protein LOC111631155 [Centruroides sculpturatus]|uniref:uncharacterized protein LOC111631155 n=1 Tax=Centruroides sculpturatus TaxID=218467 RepID=UPI000C6E08F9|nr:uncharacterized protein LOC111631155 [Centruroides sculpturatus]
MACETDMNSTQPENTTQQHQTNNTINIIQINTQKSKAACSQLIQTANERNIDIIGIQEPYYIKNKIVRSGRWRVITGNTNTRPKSGIIVCNPNIDIAKIHHLCSDKITTAIIQLTKPVILICAYLSPEEDDEECIRDLSNVLRKIKNKNMIIIGDLNGKSPVWFHEKEDRRGRMITDMMKEFNLISTNMSTHLTFFTPFAKGWTDICLVSSNVSHKIDNCETLLSPSASDHRYIITQVQDSTTKVNNKTNYFQIRQTNWAIFRHEFAKNWHQYDFPTINSHEDIDDYASHFTNALKTAGEKALSYKKVPPRKTHWWNDALSRMKQKVNRIRKKYIKRKNTGEENNYKNKYKDILKQYKKQINKTRTNSWRKFCTDSNSNGPWELPYNIIIKKQKTSYLPDIMDTDNESDINTNIKDNVEKILRFHFPNDNHENDTRNQENIRNSIQSPNSNTNDRLLLSEK